MSINGMSPLNCNVGDLAIVVNTELPDNRGQIVEVLGPQTGVPFSLEAPGHIWQVRTVSGRETLTYRYRGDGKIVHYAEGPAPDCRLRPVSGLGLEGEAQADVGVRATTQKRNRKARAVVEAA